MHGYFVGEAYRVGVILASECSISFLTEIMAAIFDFNGSGSLGKEINWGRSTVNNKERGRGGEVPLPLPSTPAPNQIWLVA